LDRKDEVFEEELFATIHIPLDKAASQGVYALPYYSI